MSAAWAVVALLFWFGAVSLLVQRDGLWIVALGVTVAAGRQALP